MTGDKFKVEVDSKLCKSCGLCVEFCPRGVLGTAPPLNKAETVDLARCTGCLLCELICPDWAIDVTAKEAER